MANGNNHPFNIDVVAIDSIVQSENELTHQQRPKGRVEKHYERQDVIDLLTWNSSSDQPMDSTDSSFSVALHSVSNKDFTRLKYLIRAVLWPIDHTIRRQLWINILTIVQTNAFKQRAHDYQSSHSIFTTLSTMIDTNFHSFPLKHSQWPKFVDTNNLCFYHLNEPTGHSLLQQIVLSFASHHPDLTYCPTLAPLSALLLHYHNENEVFYILNRLLTRNWLCGGTYLQWEAHCNVFEKLLRHFYKSAANIIDTHYPNSNIFYQQWIWWIFRYLPFFYLVKIIDCMLFEGPKILFRISLTLVHLFTKTLRREPHGSIQNINDFCREIPVSLKRLLRLAFHIRNFKRRTIDQLTEHEEKRLRSARHQLFPRENTKLTNEQSVGPQHLTQIPGKSILNHQQFLTLWNWLPVRLSLSQPVVVFTTTEHGFRLQTLLNQIDELEHSILIIKATNGEIFGGFCAGSWADRHKRTYFGFGESFLFTLLPKEMKYPWVGQATNDLSRQNQTKREMFLFVNDEKLIIGGGNGDGLSIDQSLCEGQTAHCETFNNDPLCSQAFFSIAVLEMIAFNSFPFLVNS